jgi:tyrosyl-tRNA synthetase
MLKFDSVKLRLEREQNLSFLEFNYMLLQAYDFVELNRQYGCRLQIGGSDQWGNIVNGIELNRRLEGEEIFGLTSPLITNSSGNKMGKTANGAIWLNQDLCSAYDYYQFWRNTDDLDVIKFMKLFTDIDLDQIEEYIKYKGSEINLVKKILAFEATKLCHGLEAAEQASLTASKLFEQNSLSDDLPTIEIKIDELMKVAELEGVFAKNFGLSVQVFRKSGNLWLQTTTTDNWTLAEQNQIAAEKYEANEDSMPDPMDRQELE